MADKFYEDIFRDVAEETGFDYKVVRNVYMGFWRYVRKIVVGVSIPPDLPKEEFDKYRCNIGVAWLGRLAIPWYWYKVVCGCIRKKKRRIAEWEEKNGKEDNSCGLM